MLDKLYRIGDWLLGALIVFVLIMGDSFMRRAKMRQEILGRKECDDDK